MNIFERVRDRLNPPLSPAEAAARKKEAAAITEALKRDEKWSRVIECGYVYGSPDNSEARHFSDVNLAVVVGQNYLPDTDLGYLSMRLQLKRDIAGAQRSLGISWLRQFDPAIVTQEQINSPQDYSFASTNLLEFIRVHGIRI